MLPVDIVAAKEFKADAEYMTVEATLEIPGDYMGFGYMERKPKEYIAIVENAKTVVWNGPMGVFEMPSFSKGTYAIAEAMSKVQGTTIIGGGDSAAAVEQLGFGDKMTHISTGGGASLEFLEGKSLPGIAVINDK